MTLAQEMRDSKIILPVLQSIIFLLLEAGAQTPSIEADELLRRILSASTAKDPSAFETLLIEKDTTPGFPLRAALIRSIQQGDREQNGDFSYSDEAMRRLLMRSPLKWKTPSKESLKEFREFAPLAMLDRSSFLRHRSGSVNIIIVKAEKEGWRLLFWEGLNTLLETDDSGGSKPRHSTPDHARVFR